MLLSLQFYSKKAYDFVRESFNKCLPHSKTLANWYKSVDGNPGFNDEIFKALEKMVENRGGKQLLCSMMMDEVAIRRQVEWDGKQYTGYVDMGVGVEDSSSMPVAKEALVMMIVGINEHWKVPVAYFLIDGLNGSERANVVKLALGKLHNVGVRVVSLTFDGCAANIAMASKLGANLEPNKLQTSFEHPSDYTQSVYLLLDPCHMLKLMRNLLADKKALLDSDGNLIKWSYIEELHRIQKSEGLRAGNKLTDRHVGWMREKMKVSLAAQTLSSSVATALLYMKDDLKLPQFQGCEATVKFIRIIDRLFDILNSRNPIARGYKAPMRRENEAFWRPFVTEAQQYIYALRHADLQLVRDSLRKTTVVGFLLSSMSAVSLYDLLVKKESTLRYLLTYKLSQDHLELFFSAIRSRGGWNNNPSAVHFKSAWQRLLCHQQLKEVETGNCIAQDSCKILTVSSRIERSQLTDIATMNFVRLTYPCTEQLEIRDHEYCSNEVASAILSPYVGNVVVYIAGFVARSVKKRLLCEPCGVALTQVCSSRKHSHFSLIEAKTNGGLLYPSDDVVLLCKASEKCFRANMGPTDQPNLCGNLKSSLITEVLAQLIGKDIFTMLTDHSLESDVLDDHRIILMKKVVQTFMTIRLYHHGKSFTRSLHPQTCRSSLNKTVIFKGQ